MSKPYTVLSCDPGTKNFAVSLLTARKVEEKLRFKIHGTLILDSTVTQLKQDVGRELRNFTNDFDTITGNHNVVPDALFMERFQARGLGGTTIECINFMLGAMIYKYHETTDIRLPTAATWKNRINKHVDLKNAYKKYNLHRVITNKTPHELDAVLIGMYACYQHFGLPDFECFSKGEESLEKFIGYFEQIPTLKL